MKYIIEYFVSGQAFFAGAVMLIVSAFLTLKCKNILCRVITGAIFVLGVGFMILSGAPVPIVSFGIIGVCMAMLTVFLPLESGKGRKYFWGVRFVLVALVLGLCVNEYLHMRMPQIPAAELHKMYIIGDSSYLGDERSPLTEAPTVKYGISVYDLSGPDGTAKSALSQAELISSDSAFVVVLLDMNDNYTEFSFYLDRLLLHLTSGGRRHTVVMFELPRISGHGSFIAAQRETAAKYHVKLIPRRVLAAAIYKWSSGNRYFLSTRAQRYLADVLGKNYRHCFAAKDVAGIY
jgi:hypothetical protein